MKKIAVFVLLGILLALEPMTGHAKPDAKTSQIDKADVEAALQRTFGYDPGLSWTIYSVRPSAIPGVTDVLVSINKKKPQHIYLSPSGDNAIVGEIIPFGPNPFAATRAALQAADGPDRGAKSPVMTIVVFSELQCAHCKAAQSTLDKLNADFPQVRQVFEQFPLPASTHPWATKAAQFADCAWSQNNRAFWKYLDVIFEKQGSISPDNADAQLGQLAADAGLDAERISACASTPDAVARIARSLALGKLQALDVTDVPTVFINGRRVATIADIPYDDLKRLMKFEIDHAGK